MFLPLFTHLLLTEQSTRLISASADNSVKLWDVESGKDLFTFPHQTSVRYCPFLAPLLPHLVEVMITL